VEIFNIGPLEFVVIAIIAVLLVGPERLPKMMAEGIKWLRILRDQAANARREIAAVADLDPALTDDLRRSVADIAELHPRRIVGSLIDDATGPAKPPVMRSTSTPQAAPAPVVPPVVAETPATEAPVNSFGASASSSSFAPRPADAPASREATPPAAYDTDAT
jgi:sec-independent protein translocase protein TatB